MIENVQVVGLVSWRRALVQQRGGACNSHSDSIDSEIKSVTKNSSTETWTFSLLEKYTENFKKKSISLVLGLQPSKLQDKAFRRCLDTFSRCRHGKSQYNSNTHYFTVEELHALSPLFEF